MSDTLARASNLLMFAGFAALVSAFVVGVLAGFGVVDPFGVVLCAMVAAPCFCGAVLVDPTTWVRS